MTNTWWLKQGDRLPILRATLLDENGDPIDLTGLSVAFHMRPSGPGALLINRAITITNAAAGEVEYPWQAGDSDTAGVYYGEFEITYSGGRKLTVPNTENFVVRIQASLDDA